MRQSLAVEGHRSLEVAALVLRHPEKVERVRMAGIGAQHTSVGRRSQIDAAGVMMAHRLGKRRLTPRPGLAVAAPPLVFPLVASHSSP